jgi:hypothetical protein
LEGIDARWNLAQNILAQEPPLMVIHQSLMRRPPQTKKSWKIRNHE